MAKYKIIHTPFYYLTLISLVIMLLIGTLLFGSLMLTAKLPKLFQEQIQILVELKQSAGEEKVNEVVTFLKRHPDTQGETVEHVSKEQALSMMEEAMGDDLVLADMTNPFSDVVKFRMKGEELGLVKVQKIREELMSNFAVVDVYYPQEVFGSTGKLIRQLSNIFFIGFIVLLILVFVLIHQIMRMNVIANRFMIKTMEIVGATRKFIMRPFLREAGKLALISALLACTVFTFAAFTSISKYGQVEFAVLLTDIALICLITFILAFAISLGSTWMAIEKQLGTGYSSE